MRTDYGVCSQLCHPIGKEFQFEKFNLKHRPADDFMKSQWQNGAKCLWWLIYRWGLAVCFCVGVFGSLIQQFNAGRWFIYLTDWGFFLCMLTSVFGAALVTIYHWKPNLFDVGTSRWLSFYWALHWSTLVVASLITFVYWSLLFPNDDYSPTALYNLWAHGFNTILMVVDHMLVAFPTRILHFVYPFAILLCYGLFSVIYYFAGGDDGHGNAFIYPILDWSQPGWALLTTFGCIVLVTIFCFLLFGLYKLRCLIYRKTNHSMLAIKV